MLILYLSSLSSSLCTHFPQYLLDLLYILSAVIMAGLLTSENGPKGRSSRPEIYSVRTYDRNPFACIVFFFFSLCRHSFNTVSTSCLCSRVAAFNYDPSFHNVVVVDVRGYRTCTASSKSRIYRSGKDRLKLLEGRHYFICNIPGHCEEGMKIEVDVLGNTK